MLERMGAPRWQGYLRHLRLPFNLLLSPIFFWGVLLAGGRLGTPRFWLGYLALHLFLYGGTTAFNSYYDRDEGPIGGMLEPPPVERGLLWFSLAVQALGLPLALMLGPSFALAWLLLFFVASAYSHPLTRLKARALPALLAVGLGQGAIGFAAGWLLVRPALRSLQSPEALSGMLSTAFIVCGLYIVTQSYQASEDRARGDRTLPVLLGAARALLLAALFLGLGGLLLLLQVAARFGSGWALALALFFVFIFLWLLRWAQGYDEAAVRQNFYAAMRLAGVSSAGLSAFLLWQLR